MKGERYYWALRRVLLKPVWPIVRMLRHGSGNLIRSNAFSKNVLAELKDAHVDLCICHDVFALKAGEKISSKKRAALVADLVEIPSVRDRSGKYFRTTPKIGAVLQNFQHHKIIKKADHILTIGTAMAAYVQDLSGLEPNTLRNCPVRYHDRRNTHLKQMLGLKDDIKCVAIVNGMAQGYGLEIALTAMTSLPENIHLVLLGTFSPAEYEFEIKSLISTLDVTDRVHFLGVREQEEYLDLIAGADLGLLNLDTTILNMRLSLPNRFFDFLQAGLPFVTSKIDDVVKYVQQFDIGGVLETQTPEQLAKLIEKGLSPDVQAKQRSNIRNAQDKFLWADEVVALDKILSEIPNSNPKIILLANKSIAGNKRILKILEHIEKRGGETKVFASDAPPRSILKNLKHSTFTLIE